MALSVTLGELKARVLDRADMAGSGFIDSDRLIDYINASRSELHDMLISAYEDYFRKTHSFSLVSDQENYPLPDDYFKTLKMFVLLSGTTRRALIRKFVLDDLDDSDFDLIEIRGDDRSLRYRVLGNEIYFTPKPLSTSSTVEHWYIPESGHFEKDGTDEQTLDYSVPFGWDEFIVVDSAIKCLIKEESDPSALMAEKTNLVARIEKNKQNRDVSEPERITDVARRGLSWWRTAL